MVRTMPAARLPWPRPAWCGVPCSSPSTWSTCYHATLPWGGWPRAFSARAGRLGGEIALNTDATSILFRLFNQDKDPAVWSSHA
ncbi:hypothetical protein DFAR_1050002 [Desulfarculales bacterium]